MQVSMRLPVAFSVRDEHEFFPMLHLMTRMNPKLRVTQAVTGRHVNGGCTVLWGLVYLDGERLTRQDVKAALREAGFDFQHGQRVPTLTGISGQPTQMEDQEREQRDDSFADLHVGELVESISIYYSR